MYNSPHKSIKEISNQSLVNLDQLNPRYSDNDFSIVGLWKFHPENFLAAFKWCDSKENNSIEWTFAETQQIIPKDSFLKDNYAHGDSHFLAVTDFLDDM